MSIGPWTPPVRPDRRWPKRRGRSWNAPQRRSAHGGVGCTMKRKAEAAAGVGEPDGEDHETAERDGDGRRPWEDQPEPEADAGSPTCGRAKTRRSRAEICWT